MATTALAQEKVWFDKPSYDKAERLHFERLAKLGMCCKAITNNVERYSSLTDSNDPVSPNLQDSVDSCFATKSKCKKSRSNKSLVQDNGLNDVSKCSKSHGKKVGKKVEESPLEKAEMNEILDTASARFKDIAPLVYSENRCKPKEIKEKKKKSDKKHRSEEEEKMQLPSQGNQESTCPIFPASGSLANEVAKARQHIKQSLQCMDGIAALSSAPNQEVVSRIDSLEKDVQDLKKTVQELKSIIGLLEGQVKHQKQGSQTVPEPYIAVCPAKPTAIPAKDEDDVDLFGSDSEGEDAEAAKIREQRLAAYNAKKSKKPALIAKSNIILDVKPWDDETDMKVMEVEVRKIETDGLLWGAAKLVPLAYGIQKLQISCVVEDEKVSVDWLTEQIEAIEDYVQSVDIAAFNKV